MENKQSKPIIACVIAIVMGLRFIYKGIKFTMIDITTTLGVLLTICGVVLVALSIFMFCKKSKTKSE